MLDFCLAPLFRIYVTNERLKLDADVAHMPVFDVTLCKLQNQNKNNLSETNAEAVCALVILCFISSRNDTNVVRKESFSSNGRLSMAVK